MKRARFLFKIVYVLYVPLWIKYWLKWFESLLGLILFKCKIFPNVSGIRVVLMVHLGGGGGGGGGGGSC